jgi:S-adenosyl methyltransferase
VAERASWVPASVDVTVPNAARVYDYALGGYHNFAADREFMQRAEVSWPGLGLLAHANRAYLGRVVRFLVDAGIKQFLDIGSGIPTVGNVHEVAQPIAPGVRVVYVDIDPVAVAHGQEMLAGNPDADAVQADIRRPDEVLDHPVVQELLDFSEPIGLLLIAVLHFVPDADDPAGILAGLRSRLAPGSYVAISHGIPVPVESEPSQEGVREL